MVALLKDKSLWESHPRAMSHFASPSAVTKKATVRRGCEVEWLFVLASADGPMRRRYRGRPLRNGVYPCEMFKEHMWSPWWERRE